MQMLQNNLLIAEQVSEPNSLYALANIMKHVTQPDTHPVSVHARLAH
jgi:hypothetical protein